MLTPMQEQFAQNIAKGMNQADAYRSAYPNQRMSDKTLWVKASELANNGKVMVRVKELRDKAATPAVMSAQKRLEWLTETITSEEVSVGDKLRAIDIMNKMQGEYVQKVEADVKSAVNITVELTD